MHHIVKQAYVIDLVRLGECLDCANSDEIFDEGELPNEFYLLIDW